MGSNEGGCKPSLWKLVLSVLVTLPEATAVTYSAHTGLTRAIELREIQKAISGVFILFELLI